MLPTCVHLFRYLNKRSADTRKIGKPITPMTPVHYQSNEKNGDTVRKKEKCKKLVQPITHITPITHARLVPFLTGIVLPFF